MRLNLKKTVTIFGLTTALALVPLTESNATTLSKSKNLEITSVKLAKPLEYDLKEEYFMSAMYNPYDGKEYTQTSKKTYKHQNWSTTIKNNSSKTDSVTRTVTRSRFSNGSVGASGEVGANWKLVTAKVGITAEKSWGKSDSIKVSYKWNIPAKSNTTIKTGSKAVQSIGQIKEYNRGTVVKRTPVNVKYTHGEYSDKTSKKIK
ncbi:hypothetical protein [Bacillus safensis]|uniref:hypothetical protein n=1 Tax=Bacillus safensis TaxID=561879 RepID=UPI000F069EA7|nr:hypothetical protein [Bacillus safensis]MED4592678.1 hypothetical protein [Bacillus safensis]MED4638507.1 hypothetical protein [Bacillus safensis]WBL30095.1 hypothetical protein ORQ91_02670 [Bacillus safensis]VCT96198.1 hypothetical protein AIDNDMCJ_03720 [Bacillus safensis]